MKGFWMKMYVIGLLLGAPTLCFAQESPQDTTEYIFKDENVLGERLGNEGVSITARPKGPERSLIRVRGHFVYEMLKSVESM